MTSSCHLVNSFGCTFVVNRLREMLSSSSSSSFSQEDPSKLCSSERSCFLVPCDTDLEQLATY